MTLREQLLETIETLPEDLLAETLSYVQMLQSPIRRSPGVCGGAARVRDTRIPVWTLVAYRQQGVTEAELLENYPGLTPGDLLAAWQYYAQNTDEIDRLLAEND